MKIFAQKSCEKDKMKNIEIFLLVCSDRMKADR